MGVNWNNQSTGEDVFDTWSTFLQKRKGNRLSEIKGPAIVRLPKIVYYTAVLPCDAT